MSKKTKQHVGKVYYPEVITDTLTQDLEHIKKTNDLHEEKIEKALKDYDLLIQQRISSDKRDRELHATDTIIKWAETGRRTIPYRLFNFYLAEWPLFKAFLEKLKVAGCLGSWATNPYKDAFHAEYSFDNVNISALQKYKEREIMSQDQIHFPQKLLSEVPTGGKYNVSRRIISVLIKYGKVDNYLLAKSLNGNSKLTRGRYNENINNKGLKNNYHSQIKNCFKTINKDWKTLGYKVKFDKKVSEVMSL